MKALLFRNLIRPLTERLGTALAVLLVSNGWDGALVDQLVSALGAVVLIGSDLWLTRINREDD